MHEVVEGEAENAVVNTSRQHVEHSSALSTQLTRTASCGVCSVHTHSARELHGDGDHGFPAVTAVTPR